MKNNIEETPDYIFDWVQKFSFEALEPSMKKEVLAYFSADEYNEMHQGFTAIKSHSHGSRPVAASKKQELLNRFDAKYVKEQPVRRLLTLQVSLWKAASVLLVITGGLLFLKVNGGQNPSQATLTGKTDTVYITKEVSLSPVQILDTVYIVQEESLKPSKAPGKTPNSVVSGSQEYIPAPADIRVLSVDEINGISNQAKGSSIKDDTLVRKFSFVGLL